MDLKERLEKNFLASLKNDFGVTAEKATAEQIHSALGAAVMAEITENWDKSKAAHRKNKRACYFSMEFLVGRAVFNNIMTLGIEKEVSELLANHGKGLSDLEEIEDAALGNGGLGRLAACFLESAATTNIPLDGYGIRYKYGLFKQSFEDGFQKESADDWTKHGDAWSRRVEADEVIVEYADQKVRAVPYDMPIIGFKTKNISTLRLWQAEAVQSFDFELFNKQEYINASASQILAEDISKVLYPNDDNEAGKILRIKQEYFFTCASITDILKKHIADGNSLSLLHEKIFIQLNDTHPVFAIPELIRQLVDVYGLSFDAAFATALRAFAYTNHTVMAEALEKWSAGLVRKILPRIYEIIFQINELFMAEMYAKGLDRAHIDRIKIIANETVHMANLAIFVSSCTNGVAMLHTEILKDDALKDWYTVYPERFQNKTNGITPRRWIGLCKNKDAIVAANTEASITAATSDGELYAYPSSAETYFLYYDKKFFIEDDVKSLETILSKDLGSGVTNFSFDIDNGWYNAGFFFAAGAKLFGDNGTDPTMCDFNSDKGVLAGKYMINLANNPKFANHDDGKLQAGFEARQLGATVTGAWNAEAIKASLGDDMGVTKLPTITFEDGTTANMGSMANFKLYGVNSQTKFPLEAMALAEFLTNEAAQKLRFDERSFAPTNINLVNDTEALQSNPVIAASAAQGEFATLQSSIAQMGNFWTPAEAFGAGVEDGSINMDNLQEKLDLLVESILSTLG